MQISHSADVRQSQEGSHWSPLAGGIEWYRYLSVRMPIGPSNRQFESTCPGNSSAKVWITCQPAVGQRRDWVRWNPLVEGN